MKKGIYLILTTVLLIIILNQIVGCSKATEPEMIVGGKGPAGGIIFYDKGYVSDGWRYLEVAPANSEFTAEWGARHKLVSGTQREIGTGKQNTQLMVAFLNSTDNVETDRAAQRCVALNIGGKNDWFLPSSDELELMYHAREVIGGFQMAWYWSSSQFSNNFALLHLFFNGNHGITNKDYTARVRAIRAV